MPYSKGGKTVVDNWQILQTCVNRFKSDKTHYTDQQLSMTSKVWRMTDDEMDLIEFAIYGNVSERYKAAALQI